MHRRRAHGSPERLIAVGKLGEAYRFFQIDQPVASSTPPKINPFFFWLPRESDPYQDLKEMEATMHEDLLEKIVANIEQLPVKQPGAAMQQYEEMSNELSLTPDKLQKPVRAPTIPTEEIKMGEMVLHEGGITSLNSCTRCQNFGNDFKVKPASLFYCDVGMKSVLRRTRKHLLNQIDFIFDRNKMAGKQDELEMACIEFFRIKILPRSAHKHNINPRHVMEIMRVFLDLQEVTGARFDSTGSIQDKRAQKVMQKAPLALSSIIFAKFNCSMLDQITRIPLSEPFRVYLEHVMTEEVANAYEPGLKICRRKSF